MRIRTIGGDSVAALAPELQIPTWLASLWQWVASVSALAIAVYLWPRWKASSLRPEKLRLIWVGFEIWACPVCLPAALLPEYPASGDLTLDYRRHILILIVKTMFVIAGLGNLWYGIRNLRIKVGAQG